MSTSRLTKGVRAVALFEATKGAVVLLIGFGGLTLLHRDSRLLAAKLIAWLGLNPARRFSEVFLHLASQINDRGLLLAAAFAAVFSTIRFAEAYGLWKQRTWAEWLAVISGAIYIPFEILEIVQHPKWWYVGALVTNLVVVGFMAYVLRRNSLAKRDAMRTAAREAARSAEDSRS